MAASLNPVALSNSIPLLDASSLPSAEDWAFLELIHANAEMTTDEDPGFDPGFDRFGRFRVAASFDE